MKKSLKPKFLVLAATTLILGSMLGSTSANAYVLLHCRWPGTNLYTDTSRIGGDNQTAVNEALSDFTQNTQVNVYPSDATTSMMQVQVGDWGASGWEGITYITCSNGYFTKTMSQLNTNYIHPSTPLSQRKVVWTHELGHALGLGHNLSGPIHIMWISASEAWSNGVNRLTSDDINGINAIY